MLYLLGLEHDLVGRSHECDFPEAVKSKPVIVDCALDLSAMTAAQIDSAVRIQLSQGKSLYAVDEMKLRAAAPDLLVTQNLCQVCGPAGNEVSQVIRSMRKPPRILWQTPRTVDEMFDALRVLGQETGTDAAASAWIHAAKARIKRVISAVKNPKKVRVSFLEWVDPIYCGGHWIPQMLEWAGGDDGNSEFGSDSVRLTWEQILKFRPEVILVSPCGFTMPDALAQAASLQSKPGWHDLPAAQTGRIYALDANAYFARPGPRLVDGVELLASLLHPGEALWTGPRDAYAQLQ